MCTEPVLASRRGGRSGVGQLHSGCGTSCFRLEQQNASDAGTAQQKGPPAAGGIDSGALFQPAAPWRCKTITAAGAAQHLVIPSAVTMVFDAIQVSA